MPGALARRAFFFPVSVLDYGLKKENGVALPAFLILPYSSGRNVPFEPIVSGMLLVALKNKEGAFAEAL